MMVGLDVPGLQLLSHTILVIYMMKFKARVFVAHAVAVKTRCAVIAAPSLLMSVSFQSAYVLERSGTPAAFKDWLGGNDCTLVQHLALMPMREEGLERKVLDACAQKVTDANRPGPGVKIAMARKWHAELWTRKMIVARSVLRWHWICTPLGPKDIKDLGAEGAKLHNFKLPGARLLIEGLQGSPVE